MKQQKKRTLQNLRVELFKRGITQTEAANQMGLSRQCFYNRMSGKAKFSLAEAQKLAKVLSVDIQKVFEIIEVPMD